MKIIKKIFIAAILITPAIIWCITSDKKYVSPSRYLN